MEEKMSEEKPSGEPEPDPPAEPEVVVPPQPAGALVTRVKAEIIPIEKGRGITLRSFEDLQRWSNTVVAAGTAPKNWTMAMVAVAVQTGMEVGLTPMAALRAIYVVNGLPAFRGAAALGLLQSRPDICTHLDVGCIWDEQGPSFGFVRTRRRGGDVQEDRYTRAQAQAAGRWGKRTRSGEDTPWITDPDQMLMWRAVGRHCQKLWADLLFGFPIVEAMDEFRGYGATPAPVPPAPGPAGPDRPAKDPLLEGLAAPPEPAAEAVPAPTKGPQVGGLEGQLRESLRADAEWERAYGETVGMQPPFASHAEADAAIAAEETKREKTVVTGKPAQAQRKLEQKALFAKPKRR
jgi:hypothetical protein